MMKTNALTFKLAVLTGLLVLSSVPRWYVDDVVEDRRRYEHEAVQSVIANSHAKHEIGTVKLEVPFFRFFINDKKKTERFGDTKTFTPSQLDIKFTDAIEVRHRGIFNIPVYKGDLAMTGSFKIPSDIDPTEKDEQVTANSQILTFNFTHPEAISQFSIKIDGQVADTERTSGGLQVHFTDHTYKPGEEVKFLLQARLNGYEALSIKTAAKELNVTVDSKWPHLGFEGQLPLDQSGDEKGVHAGWKLVQAQESQNIIINYVEPVNIYTQVSRSVKYGFLISLLCLSVVFLMETLGGLRVQGMQYFLMTLPLSCFYVLLLAGSEHIGFMLSYAGASLSVVLLIYFYFSGAASRKQSITLAGSLATVYALILTMLTSEDYALLIGAITLFACLSAFMIMTRKMDWSDLRRKELT